MVGSVRNDMGEGQRWSAKTWFRLGKLGLLLLLVGELVFPVGFWVLNLLLAPQLNIFVFVQLVEGYGLVAWLLIGVGFSMGAGVFVGYARLLKSSMLQWAFGLSQAFVWVAIGLRVVFGLVYVIPFLLVVVFGLWAISAFQNLWFLAYAIAPILVDGVLWVWGLALMRSRDRLHQYGRQSRVNLVAGLCFIAAGVLSILVRVFFIMFWPFFFVYLSLAIQNTILNLVRVILVSLAVLLFLFTIIRQPDDITSSDMVSEPVEAERL
jgi:hypothetical protein